MIVDQIENAHLYAGLGESIAKALDILKDPALREKEDGQYEVNGDKLFYIVQRYTTKPLADGRLEAHRKYIDIQFVAAGEEIIGYRHLDNLHIDEPYNAGSDIEFYNQPDDITHVRLKEGMFCILFPEDAHMPCREINGPAEVAKVVVKVLKD